MLLLPGGCLDVLRIVHPGFWPWKAAFWLYGGSVWQAWNSRHIARVQACVRERLEVAQSAQNG